jgi:hypothetical protein
MVHLLKFHHPNGRMPGQLPTASEVLQSDNASVKRRAQAKIAAMVGKEVIVKGSNNCIMTWKLIANHEPDCNDIIEEKESFLLDGLRISIVRTICAPVFLHKCF